MFGLGTWEIALVLLVALLVLGPDKLPQIARTLGRGLREVRRATNELRFNLEIDEPLTPRPRGAEPEPAAPSPYGDDAPPADQAAATAPAAAPPEPAELSSSKPKPEA